MVHLYLNRYMWVSTKFTDLVTFWGVLTHQRFSGSPPPISSNNLDTLSPSMKWLCRHGKCSVVWGWPVLPGAAVATTTTLALGAILPYAREWTQILSLIPLSTSNNWLQHLMSLSFGVASGITETTYIPKSFSSWLYCTPLCDLL